jgi:hypothetical protein
LANERNCWRREEGKTAGVICSIYNLFLHKV